MGVCKGFQTSCNQMRLGGGFLHRKFNLLAPPLHWSALPEASVLPSLTSEPSHKASRRSHYMPSTSPKCHAQLPVCSDFPGWAPSPCHPVSGALGAVGRGPGSPTETSRPFQVSTWAECSRFPDGFTVRMESDTGYFLEGDNC